MFIERTLGLPAKGCREHGIQREISIPLGETLFTGRVDRLGGLFVGPDVAESDISPMLQVLKRFGLQVEVGC